MTNAIQAIVTIQNDQLITTSKNIADVFEKRHADVLRAIENLLPELPETHQRNFALVDYLDEKGEKRPVYNITRDGFTLLAMGFTGKKALSFKLAYIDQFNAMEKALTGQAISAPECKTKQVLIGGLTADQQDAIKALVKARAEALPTDKRAKATITMWSAVKTKFGMTYKAIAPEEYSNVISLIARVPLEGEFIAATDAPTDAPKTIEPPTPVPSIAPDFTIERIKDWHTNFQQGQEAVNAIRLSVCTGDAKRLDQVKYALRNAQSKIYNIDFCADGISTGYIDMVSRYAIIGMQSCNAPLVANRI